MPRKAATRRVTTKAPGGLHPVFGPVADPAPDFGRGHIYGGGWLPAWSSPIADPVPPFAAGGWRTSLAAAVDRQKLDDASIRQLTALRAKRVAATIAALEQEAAILESEWAVLSKVGPGLVVPGPHLPDGPHGGDPVPEIRPVDFVRYLYEARAAALQHTIAFLNQARSAIEGRR
jgi:hypothetical protein